MAKQTYSFLDVQAAIVGPGGAFSLSGGGNSEEGISIEYADEINTMQVGADGIGQHSLSANRSAKITVRLLKTSPVNAQLSAMLNLQRASADAHGQNTISVTDTSRGDVTTASQVAFNRWPSLNYAKVAGFNEWVFDAINVNTSLGGF